MDKWIYDLLTVLPPNAAVSGFILVVSLIGMKYLFNHFHKATLEDQQEGRKLREELKVMLEHNQKMLVAYEAAIQDLKDELEATRLVCLGAILDMKTLVAKGGPVKKEQISHLAVKTSHKLERCVKKRP